MNILIIGLGSIGQRHLRNLKKIMPKAKIFAYRRKFITPALSNNNLVKKINLKKKYDITYLSNIKKLNEFNINAAFICSPSSFHIPEAIELAKQNINLFIEKPLGHNLKNINKLERLIQKNKIITMMGYQMRFNPMYIELKKILSKKFNKPKLVMIHHGEHIDDFHKYEDYKISYASNKKLGGGINLTQIHEIDYFLDLFNTYKITKQKTISTKLTDLKLNVEDTSNSIFFLKNKFNKCIVNLSLNFYERSKSRYIKMIFENKKILVDFNKKYTEIDNGKKKYIKKFKFNNNQIFIKEIKFFLEHVKRNKKINKSLNIYNGIKTLKLALKIKNAN